MTQGLCHHDLGLQAACGTPSPLPAPQVCPVTPDNFLCSTLALVLPGVHTLGLWLPPSWAPRCLHSTQNSGSQPFHAPPLDRVYSLLRTTESLRTDRRSEEKMLGGGMRTWGPGAERNLLPNQWHRGVIVQQGPQGTGCWGLSWIPTDEQGPLHSAEMREGTAHREETDGLH